MSLFSLTIVFLSASMHAGWNLLARSQNNAGFFLRVLLLIATIGLAPTLVAEFKTGPLFPLVWRHLIVAGCCQSIYFLGLYRGYQSGDFTVVYPLARATPVMVIAILDVARGQAPTLFGWLGLLLIVIGCVLAPLISLRDFSLKRYWNVTTIWIAVTALGTIGYTAADSDVAKLLSPGLVTAVRYHVLESCMALIGYWAILSVLREPVRITVRWSDWRSSGMATAGLFGSYALILWAYQLSEHISYIVAVRQLSIVLGVGAAVILFREPSPRFRLVAALLITGGTMCISLGG